MSDQDNTPQRRSRLLNLLTDGALLAAGFCTGMILAAVVAEKGTGAWFAIVGIAAFMAGLACHQILSRQRWILTAGCLLAFSAGTALAHLRGITQPAAPAAKPEEPSLVKAETLHPESFTETLTLRGTVAPGKSAVLAFPCAGHITRLDVRENHLVRKDQPLAALDDRQYQSSLLEARAACTQARAERERFSNLVKENTAPQRLLDNAVAAHEMAKAQVAILEDKIKDTILKAPFSGQISVRHMEKGEYATPGKPVFELINTDPVKIETGVPEALIDKVQPNAKVTITLDAQNNAAALNGEITFSGNVSRIAPTTSPNTPIYKVEVLADNPEGALRPGRVARLTLTVKTYPRATLLTLPVVNRENGEHYVFQLRTLDTSKADWIEAHPRLGEAHLQKQAALLADAGHFYIARKTVLRKFAIHGDQYVVLDDLGQAPVITRGGHRLKDLTPVRTGILKSSRDLLAAQDEPPGDKQPSNGPPGNESTGNGSTP